jgi:hypothetical protein
MRQRLPVIVVAALLAAIAVDVVAAGVRTATHNGHVYSVAPAGITMAAPGKHEEFRSRRVATVN